nr:unnamed protein product [Callosobruchus analis]
MARKVIEAIPPIEGLLVSRQTGKVLANRKHTPAFALTKLHPSYMLKQGINHLKKDAEYFRDFYQFEDIAAEIDLCFHLWKGIQVTDDKLKEKGIEIIDLLNGTDPISSDRSEKQLKLFHQESVEVKNAKVASPRFA